MAYERTNSKGQSYWLHMKDVTLRGGRLQRIYFYARDVRDGVVDALPAGYTTVENARTGLLVLVKDAQAAVEADDTRSSSPEEEEAPSADTANDELGLGIAGHEVRLELVTDAGFDVLLPTNETLRVMQRFLASAARLAPAIHLLEELINAPDTTEAALQEFLETYPEILLGDHYSELRAHIVLEPTSGDLIPDFVLRPVSHDLWDVVELKRPQVPLITYQGGRPQFTRRVASGISQIHYYAEALEDRAVRNRLDRRYGIDMFRPRLQLIIGRSVGLDRADLRRAAGGLTNPEVIPWDDVLAWARNRFS